MPNIEDAKQWYPEDDPVHGFDHVLRVYRLAERLGQAEEADLEIVRAAALLHDAQGENQDGDSANDQRLEHHMASAEFAEKVLQAEGWERDRIEAVQHCIRAHRFRDNAENPQSLEAQVLFDADKLDAIGATGVGRAIAYAARAGQPSYAPVSMLFKEQGQLEAGESYSAYHEYLFKLQKLKERLYTPSGRALAAERHAFMAEFFDRLRDEMEDRK